MIVYIISFIVYLLVFIVGMVAIHKKPQMAEKIIHKVAILGFFLQIFINWLFWGDLSAFNPIATLASMERNALNLMFLHLISIFCYAGMFVLLLKANEFYNPNHDKSS